MSYFQTSFHDSIFQQPAQPYTKGNSNKQHIGASNQFVTFPIPKFISVQKQSLLIQMKINNKSLNNRSLLNLNIGLIEQTSKSFKNYTPKQQISENNPEKTLKATSSQFNLLNKNPSKSKLHTEFTKYEASSTLNRSINTIKSSSNLQVLSPSSKMENQMQPKRPRILSKTKPLYTSSLITQFKPLKTLGKGRFGNVSMVLHKPTGALYAIKDISTQKMTTKLEQRLLAQIKIQSFLEHKNCLQLYKCFNEGKHLYLVLELGEQSLFDILRKKRYLSEVQTAYYLKQVISALIYMHKNGVIHRDLKPQNIIIVNGVAKLGDFGWATYTPKEKRITFCGTLDYVSPQIVTGEYYDEMVDVWSVGVLCYQLCTGQAPFESRRSREDTYKKILTVDVTFPKHLSPLVQDFISKLLVRDPKQRMSLQQALQHKWINLYK